MPRSPRRPRRTVARGGTLRLLVVLVALLGINIYFLGLRGGTSIGALMRNARIRGGVPATTTKPVVKSAPLPEDPPGARIVDGSLADGQTIAQVLAPNLGRSRAAELEKILGERVDLAAIRAGDTFALVYDIEDRLVAFELRTTPTLLYRVDVSARRPVLVAIEGRAETRNVELQLPAGPPLWDALRKAGESAQLGERLSELFASEGEIASTAVAPGERLRVIAEKRLVGGRFLRYGRIIAAEWSARGGVRRAFYFAGVQPGYFTERGEAVERIQRQAPFRALRGTTPSRRGSPRGNDSHQVIDVAAPQGGSPAVACAAMEGTLVAMSRNPNGSILTVQNEGGRVTYANLARLASGLHLGQHIARGQALGRTGAVLSITCDGGSAACDGHTMGARLPSLPAAERPRFGETIAPLLERLRAIAIRPTDSLAPRGLSAIP